MTSIALLGDRDLGYLTHRALEATLELLPPDVDARWVASDSAEARATAGFDGLWVVPGTPYRDAAAVLAAIGRAREQGQPVLGTCGGFQHQLLDLGRHVAGIAGAVHAEDEPGSEAPLVAPLACGLYGEERVVVPVPGTRLAAICGDEPFVGFHFCGFGLNESRLPALTTAGVVVGAWAEDAGVEAVELPGHPFYLGTLFQPQVGALRGEPLHPLVGALVEAASGA
jgi:CTP synthase (UTP-ammonia lyase)